MSRTFLRASVAAVCALLVSVTIAANDGRSGPVGIFGLIDRVVFEPSEAAPERIQVWGAFAYVDGGITRAAGASEAARGYLYFKAPNPADNVFTPAQLGVVLNEWKDLKAVAGTGQVVGFGSWGYIGAFDGLRTDVVGRQPPYMIERAPRGGATTDLRVRPATEAPTNAATYQTDSGIVKIPATGIHADLVRALKAARF